MPRCSNKSIAEILSSSNVSLIGENHNDNHLALLDRKIVLATEGFITHKFCEIVLKDSTGYQMKMPLQFVIIS